MHRTFCRLAAIAAVGLVTVFTGAPAADARAPDGQVKLTCAGASYEISTERTLDRAIENLVAPTAINAVGTLTQLNEVNDQDNHNRSSVVTLADLHYRHAYSSASPQDQVVNGFSGAPEGVVGKVWVPNIGANSSEANEARLHDEVNETSCAPSFENVNRTNNLLPGAIGVQFVPGL